MGECPNAPVLSRGSNLHTPFQMMSVSVCWNYMRKQVECVVSRYSPEPISLFQGAYFLLNSLRQRQVEGRISADWSIPLGELLCRLSTCRRRSGCIPVWQPSWLPFLEQKQERIEGTLVCCSNSKHICQSGNLEAWKISTTHLCAYQGGVGDNHY